LRAKRATRTHNFSDIITFVGLPKLYLKSSRSKALFAAVGNF
jgi:hypothetical protein